MQNDSDESLVSKHSSDKSLAGNSISTGSAGGGFGDDGKKSISRVETSMSMAYSQDSRAEGVGGFGNMAPPLPRTEEDFVWSWDGKVRTGQ